MTMLPCESCREQLLDYLYDLLDEAERAEFDAHLRACPACAAELAVARSQQSLLKHAAHAVPHVPEFTAPKDEPAALSPAAQNTQPAAEPPVAPRRSLWSRSWVIWSAAAAIFVIVSAGVSYYNHFLASHQRMLTQARKNLRDLDSAYAALPAKYAALQQSATREARSKIGPHLHVVGPTTFQPNARGHIQVSVRSTDGKLSAADLRVKLIDEKAGKAQTLQMLHSQTDVNGPARIEIDPGLAKTAGELKIVVEARTTEGVAVVEEAIRLAAPSFVARIDTNKSVYAIPDVLFCRALLLDRYSLHPPEHAIPLRLDLVDPAGKVVRSTQARTGAGGTLAAEFALEENYVAGKYSIRVQPVDPGKDIVQAATSAIDVLRETDVPDVQFDVDRFLPGEIASGFLRSTPKKLPANAQVQLGQAAPVAVVIQPYQEQAMRVAPGSPNAGGGGMMGAAQTAKAQGNANLSNITGRFQIPVPKNLPPGVSRLPIVIQFGAGKEKREIKADLPIAPTDFAVDFFPEGGDLIAKVKNRVFYRVRSKSGQSVQGEGSLIVLHEKGVIDSHYENGLGYFEFVPDVKEKYTVRLTTPIKVEELSDPFAKLPIQLEGLVLHVPSAVGRQGDPIHVRLRHRGVDRKLLIVAECRGQIVDQRWIDAKPGSTEVTLQPTAEAFGMVRVMAYEVVLGGEKGARAPPPDLRLRPVAERLVFRAAAQGMKIRAALNAQQFQEGRRVKANIETLDEKDRHTPAYLLACVVDGRFQNRPRGLAAHFQLFNEVRTGADLEDVQLVVNDSSESIRALERFLGTHGWRRWKQEVPAEAAEFGVRGIVFSTENTPLTVLADQTEMALVAALTPIHKSAFMEKNELEGHRDQAVAQVNLALANLSLFEASVRERIGIAFGAVVVGCLALSLILMIVGTIRIARTQRPATALFGTAFGSLVACIVLIVIGRNSLSFGSTNTEQAVGPLPLFDVAQKLENAMRMPAQHAVRDRQIVGVFAMAAPEKRHEQQKAEIQALAQTRVYSNMHNVSKALAMRDGTIAVDKKQDQQRVLRNLQWTDRLNQARGGIRESEAAKLDAKKGAVPVAKGSPEKKVAEKTQPPISPPGAPKVADNRRRSPEFAYEYSPELAFDTLLWHPSLWLPEGRGQVHFDLAAGQASYRLLILGHGHTGRFGFFEKSLDVPGIGR